MSGPTPVRKPGIARRAGLVASALLVLGVLALGALHLRGLSLRSQLAARVQKIHAGIERLSHVPNPTPGVAGDAMLPALERLNSLIKPMGLRIDPACLRVARGQAAWSSLPIRCRTAVTATLPIWQALLAATHARLAGGPDGFSIGRGDPASSHHRDPAVTDYLYLGSATYLLVLALREQLERGQVSEALSTCVDGLALGRDLAHGGHHLQVRWGASMQFQLLQPCIAALEAGDAAGRRDALARIEAVRAGMPAFADLILNDSTDELIWLSRPSDESNRVSAAIERTKRDFDLLRRDRQAKRLAEVADEVRVARQRVMDAAAAADRERDREGKTVADSLGQLTKEVDRFSNQRLELDVLIATAAALVHRDREGRWPTSIAELRPRTVGEPIKLEGRGLDIEASAPRRWPGGEMPPVVLTARPPH